MTRTGRPVDAGRRLAILRRLAAGRTMAEVVREGPWNRDQVKRQVRALRRDHLVIVDRYFSHLDVDGAGGLRFALTAAGEIALARRAEEPPTCPPLTAPPGGQVGGNSSIGGGGKSPVDLPPTRPRGMVPTIDTAHSPASKPPQNGRRVAGRIPLTAQFFDNFHNLRATMAVEGSPAFERVGWDAEWEWKRKKQATGVLLRERRLPNGVVVRLCGTAKLTAACQEVYDPKLPESDRPRAAWERAQARIAEARRLMERALRCPLGEPRFTGHPKGSVLNDPVAQAAVAAGVTVHGEKAQELGWGLDTTPDQRGTLEHVGPIDRMPELIRAIDRHVAATDLAGGEVKRLREELEAQRVVTATIEARLSEMGRGDAVRGMLQYRMERRLTAIEGEATRRGGNGGGGAEEWAEGRAA